MCNILNGNEFFLNVMGGGGGGTTPLKKRETGNTEHTHLHVIAPLSHKMDPINDPQKHTYMCSVCTQLPCVAFSALGEVRLLCLQEN